MPGPPRLRFDYDLLDPDDPFELDPANRPHLYKRPPYGETDLYEMWWDGDPLFYPAQPDGEADWLIVGMIPGNVCLCAPVAPPRASDHTQCRPIGLYPSSDWLRTMYDEDR